MSYCLNRLALNSSHVHSKKTKTLRPINTSTMRSERKRLRRRRNHSPAGSLRRIGALAGRRGANEVRSRKECSSIGGVRANESVYDRLVELKVTRFEMQGRSPKDVGTGFAGLTTAKLGLARHDVERESRAVAQAVMSWTRGSGGSRWLVQYKRAFRFNARHRYTSRETGILLLVSVLRRKKVEINSALFYESAIQSSNNS
jgi:hypothetical protein